MDVEAAVFVWVDEGVEEVVALHDGAEERPGCVQPVQEHAMQVAIEEAPSVALYIPAVQFDTEMEFRGQKEPAGQSTGTPDEQ